MPTTSRKLPPPARPTRYEPDLDKALQRVMELMAIPGKSGQEGKVAQYVVKQLRQAGAPAGAIQTDSAHLRAPIKGETGNLVFTLPGTFRAPRRLLSSHMDTVPICVGSLPVRKAGHVRSANPRTGLGADDRAGVAATLTAAVEILKRKLPHPPLTFCWFIQEEIGLHGARLVKQSLLKRPKLAFNFDGGSPFKVTIGATGGYRMAIEIEGLASHAGGAPEKGVSAIAIAGLAIADLQRGGWHGDIRQDGKHGTSNIGVIHGGEATNVVTDRVLVRAEARSHDPQFRRQIVRQIEQAFERAAQEVKSDCGATGKVHIDGRLDYESFLLARDEPCVNIAAEAVRAVGRTPELAIANGGLDANWITRHGIPTVSLGAGQLNQHMTTELLDVAQFKDACRIALRLATGAESASGASEVAD